MRNVYKTISDFAIVCHDSEDTENYLDAMKIEDYQDVLNRQDELIKTVDKSRQQLNQRNSETGKGIT